MNTSEISKLEKGRAEKAYSYVKSVVDELYRDKPSEQKKYRSYVTKLPQMILSNGLGQTIAFVFSKAKITPEESEKDLRPDDNPYKVIYKQLSLYLRSNSTSRIRMPEGKELIEWIVELDSKSYIYLSNEVISLFKWMKRFVEGMIEPEEGGE